MAIVKVIELVGTSSKSWEDAVQQVVKHASETLRHITGVDLVPQTLHCEEGKITQESGDGTLEMVPFYDPEQDEWSQIEIRGSLENLPNVTIREVMSTEIISVSPETGIKEVAWLMRTHGVHCILVLNAYHQVVGIISVFDFVHLVADAD